MINLTSPAGERVRTRRPVNGTALALAIFAVSAAQCITFLAPVVHYTYPLLTVAVTAGLVGTRRVAAALELNLWTWATAAGLRRLVDWSNQEITPDSPILATASLAALLIGLSALGLRRRWPPGYGFAVFVVVSAGVSASVVGLANYGALPTAVSALLWFSPVAVGLVLLTAGDDREEYVAAVLRFALWGLFVLSAYALVQWALAPAWDRAWLRSVAPRAELLGSPFGRPEPFGLRPFSLTNSPYLLGHLLAWLLVSQIGQPKQRLLSYAGIAMGVVALGLTGIRAAWLTAALAIIVLAVSRRARLWRFVALGTVGLALAVVLFPQAAETIGRRLDTLQAVESDVSLNARVTTYTEALPAFLEDPVGAGLGATGAGARANVEDVNPFGVLDSSYLDILRIAGSVLGTLVIITILLLSITVFIRSRGLPAPYPAWSAIALVIPVDMLVGNVTTGAPAVVSWLVIGACAAASAGEGRAGTRGTAGSRAGKAPAT